MTAENDPTKPPLIVEHTFDAPFETVWKAITDKDQMKQWYFDLDEFNPEVGFEFDFCVETEGVKYLHLCKISEVIPGKKLAYTWRYEGHGGDSLVTFELFAEGGKTTLRLTHEGVETFPKTADFARANFVEGWTSLIGTRLKEFVGDGSSTGPGEESALRGGGSNGTYSTYGAYGSCGLGFI